MERAPWKSVSNSWIKTHLIPLGFFFLDYSVSQSQCSQAAHMVSTYSFCRLVSPLGALLYSLKATCTVTKEKTLKTCVREHLWLKLHIVEKFFLHHTYFVFHFKATLLLISTLMLYKFYHLVWYLYLRKYLEPYILLFKKVNSSRNFNSQP